MKKSFTKALKNIASAIQVLARTILAAIAAPPRQVPTAHCSNIDALLVHLCDYDHQLHGWILRWLAYPLRNPGAKMDTCLVINGGQDTGKNLFFDRVMAALYCEGVRSISERALNSSFNAWASGARFVVVSGEFSKRNAARLKALLTGSSVIIEERDKPYRKEANLMNFVFVSGAKDFLRAEYSDRRFFVVEAPPAQVPMFYRAVIAEIENGGIDAFRDYLVHTLDMTGFDEHTPPPRPAYVPAKRKVA